VWQRASCLTIIDTGTSRRLSDKAKIRGGEASHPANPPLLASHVARREVSLDRKSDTEVSIILKHLLIRKRPPSFRFCFLRV
jgi:hypothetical protein